MRVIGKVKCASCMGRGCGMCSFVGFFNYPTEPKPTREGLRIVCPTCKGKGTMPRIDLSSRYWETCSGCYGRKEIAAPPRRP